VEFHNFRIYKGTNQISFSPKEAKNDRIEYRTQSKTEYVEIIPGWVKWVGIGAGILVILLALALIRR
jgi:hypothetical protein